jgi:nucleoside-diphosphate-sugar epimerase
LRALDSADLDLIFSETRTLWEEMRDQSIFITGGTGFFGSWLLESFLYINRHLDLNAQMTVLTRNAARFAQRSPHLASNPSITLVEGDIRSFAPPDGEFAYVIHAATDVASAVESPIDQYAAIVDGTRRVLEFAETHGTQKFLLTSSGAVYGKQPAHLSHVPEDYAGAPDVLHPSAVYGEGKRVSELLCALHAESSGLQIKVARCFAFAGPCLPLDGNFAIGNFIRDAIKGGPIRIGGDGTSVRSYLYAADLAIWLWTLLFQAPSLLAFNIGSEDAISIGYLAKTVASTLDPNVQIQTAKRPVEGVAPARYVPSTARAQQRLHLRQTVSLQESIRRTAEWHGFRKG